ncbi:MAG: hypothetical protein DI539_15790 [Flavobacterium psychrophilum]|nr:MAG: hypothetical protein DI539_15790 [Flavobacterium psychrophilum]
MKKIILLLTISTLTLLSCSGDDSSPVSNPEPPQTEEDNIVRVYSEDNFIISVHYWFDDNDFPSGAATAWEGNYKVRNADLLTKLTINTNGRDAVVDLNLNHSNLIDQKLDKTSKYQVIFKEENGVRKLDKLIKIDND